MKNIIKKFANKCGFELSRYIPNNSFNEQLNLILESNKINLVLDVGANVGQYAQSLRKYGYQNKIISFEPMANEWLQLKEASKKDRNWSIYDQCAVGDKNEIVEINLSGNSVSSSILPMLEQHSLSAPESMYVGKEKVQTIRIDDIVESYDSYSNIFLKIDTQGYEEKVLNGGLKTLELAKGVQIECSLFPLYKGQMLYEECFYKIKSFGYKLWSIEPGFVDKGSGKMLQFDAIFIRE
jgi:FkbM family methyltransferase